ncbi:hypothetical protein MPQ_0563 [Methylovorus sp. MP688]|nr:hypothetical protein MPQ_0563 [Methylovorus sp. MP688]
MFHADCLFHRLPVFLISHACRRRLMLRRHSSEAGEIENAT